MIEKASKRGFTCIYLTFIFFHLLQQNKKQTLNCLDLNQVQPVSCRVIFTVEWRKIKTCRYFYSGRDKLVFQSWKFIEQSLHFFFGFKSSILRNSHSFYDIKWFKQFTRKKSSSFMDCTAVNCPKPFYIV